MLVRALFLGVLAAAPTAQAAPRPENAWLTQADAASRAARLSHVAYTLSIDITGKERFSATSTVDFTLKDKREALTLDLDHAAITAVQVNGRAFAPRYNDWFITVPASALASGHNSITVSYTRPYNTNGEGLHRLLDSADGQIYLFSQLAPANAHQVFAVFDQPDIKASHALTVLAPTQWQVISTARETGTSIEGANQRWVFPPTKKISTYAFSLHAGPYQMWQDLSGKYPLRLFARQSVAQQVHAAEWFEVTQRGLAYFDRYFGVDYPFAKYDQLLVPDHLYGAMENIAAVTYAEARHLHAGAASQTQRAAAAQVIMHEMAHQWFGDLVTMRWWNGLWLSESFASFMGSMAMADATEFTQSWQTFFADDKQRAYQLDAGAASHAVDAPIASSEHAYDNLDAITYIKGASALKQLRHLLGDQVFRAGVHNYLVKYQFGNARLDQFIAELGHAARRNLGPWTNQWLYQAGLNTLNAEVVCRDGKLTALNLRQGSVGAAPLRQQRVQVATFAVRGDALVPLRQSAVTYRGAVSAVPALVASDCPDLVYPNYQDWGYVKVLLDARSRATLASHIHAVDDPLLRAMLWQGLWDEVLDGTYPLDRFVAVALSGPDRATANDVKLLEKLERGAQYLQAMQLPPAATASMMNTLHDGASAGIAAASDTPLRRRWQKLHLDTSTDFAGMMMMLDDTVAPLDAPMRWHVIGLLNQYDHAGSAALIARELARDNSPAGQAAALRASVLRPDPAIKAEWLAKIMDPKSSEPFARLQIAMANLYAPAQAALGEASAEQRLLRLAQMDSSATPAYARAYAASMIPAACTTSSVARLERALREMNGVSAATGRALRSRYEDDKRCVAIRSALTPVH